MKKISRRDFLKVTGLVGAAAALTACGGSASSTAASTASSAAGSTAASAAALGADTQAIVDRGVLKVGVKNAVQGFSFQDTLTGEYKGLEDSLAEMIAEHLGVDVEFTTVTAATRGELLDSGDIDAVLATFTITEERKKTWDFSTPYYTDYVSVLVEDSTGIKGLADLKDKVVGVSSGSTSARALVKAMIDEGVLDGANFDADTFNADTWKDGISFRQSRVTQVRQQNVVIQRLVIEVADMEHADGIIRISVYDDGRTSGRVGSTCIKRMHPDAVWCGDKRIPQGMVLLQAVQPGNNLRIFSSHERFRFHHILSPVFRAE